MKKIILFAIIVLTLAACSNKGGEVNIQLPADFKGNKLVVSHLTIDNMFKATSADDLVVAYDTLEVKNGIAKMKLDPQGSAYYVIESSDTALKQPEFYASPDDNLEVVIKKFEPLDYTVTGSELMEDLTTLTAIITPIQNEYRDLVSKDEVSEAEMKAMLDRYDNAIKKFVADHPKSPAVPFAILDLSGDDFKKVYDNMTPEAKKSILMPYAESYNRQVEQMIRERDEENARKAEVASGKNDAPGFSLPDLAGKKVSLSDFRGKWVVLDFWGSWCGWCVKGFPALKEAYAKYGDKIVVIGIDCNESEEDWRKGVKEHQLPWLNLYNGYNRDLYNAYNIEGFPTKAIINPEGKLVDLTTGEDPAFFTRLDSFLN